MTTQRPAARSAHTNRMPDGSSAAASGRPARCAASAARAASLPRRAGRELGGRGPEPQDREPLLLNVQPVLQRRGPLGGAVGVRVTDPQPADQAEQHEQPGCPGPVVPDVLDQRPHGVVPAATAASRQVRSSRMPSHGPGGTPIRSAQVGRCTG